MNAADKEKMHCRMQLNKRGQIAGQVFIYIMAVIVIGGIVLIGYSAIKNILDKSCKVEQVTFKSDIEGLIEKYTSYGSVNKKNLGAPCSYDTVCFVDATDIYDISQGAGSGTFECDNKLIQDSVNSGVQQNIFVMSNKQTIPVGYSQLIRLEKDAEATTGKCLCIKQVSGNFNIKFSGYGSYTQISSGG